jgi:shikimate kinase
MLVYLVGYMGSGKTTVGRKLASKLNFDYIDMDELIEEKCRLSVENIFLKYDEHAFRKIEHEILESTFSLKNTIVSTGGGTPCFFDNMEQINKNGTSVYIKMHINSLYDRLIHSKRKRPLLLNKSPEEIKSQIVYQLDERETFYNQAHYTIKGENLDVHELAQILTK